MSQYQALFPRDRVVVLRTTQPSRLGGVLRERAHWAAGIAASVISLPAGPYRYPFAAALELSRQFHSNDEPVNSDAAGLGRAAMAQALSPLVLKETLLVVPRLDWLDAHSVNLFADLVQVSTMASQMGLGSRFRLWGGLPAEEPAAGLQALLNLAQCCDETLDHASLPVLTAHQLSILDVLAAAPNPLDYETLQEVCGLQKRALDAALRGLVAAQLVDPGPRIGMGSASDLLPERDLTCFRQALLASSAARIPDARLALQASLGLASGEGWQLGLNALAEEEGPLARYRFESSTRACHVLTSRQELLLAQALALSGAADAAHAHYCAQTGASSVEFARLAFALCRAGRLTQREADAALRRCQRSGGHSLEYVTLRAELLLDAGLVPSALKLLQRIPTALREREAPQTRAAFCLTLARAWHAMGQLAKARAALNAARQVCASSRLSLLIEHWACQCSGEADQARVGNRLLEVAAPLLDVENVKWALSLSGSPQDAAESLIRGLGTGDLPQPALATGQFDLRRLWRELQGQGANMMATLIDGELCVMPPAARLQPGLDAWLAVQLNELSAFPGLAMVKLAPPPNAGEFSGDVLLAGIGPLGPLLVFLSRTRLSKSRSLLALLHDPRALLRLMLKNGQLSLEDAAKPLQERSPSTNAETS